MFRKIKDMKVKEHRQMAVFLFSIISNNVLNYTKKSLRISYLISNIVKTNANMENI